MPANEDLLESMRARARDLTGQLQRMTDAMGGLQEKIGQVSVTAVSRDGLVRATVGSDGRPRDLHLDARIYHDADATALARTILDTIEVAAAEAADQVREICRPYVDAQTFDSYASGDLTQVMERMRQRLPFTEE
ncbi:YbaB/EbfC family nucleoid-associated protein [Micromonospora sp. NPDC004336]